MDEKIKEYLSNKMKEYGSILFPLFDPPKLASLGISPKEIGEIAKEASETGVPAFLLGGSIGVTSEMIDKYAGPIKKYGKVILFPSGSFTISRSVDAILVIHLLNSRNPYWIINAQTYAAPLIKKYKIEPISMAYLIVEPGETVGYVGEANLIPRSEKGCEIARCYALAAQHAGFKYVYLEAGSGAKEPVPNEMIRSVKKEIEIPLGVGGGIRSSEQAREKARSGADFIFMGTKSEEEVYEYCKGRKKRREIRKFFEEIVNALKEGAKERSL